MQLSGRNHKDTVFRFLYNNKKRLLELYNALNGSNYTNPDELTIVTLKGHTFLNMKNDVSFILNFELNLFEHQSTLCPNIPLRFLYYLSSSLIEMIPLIQTYRTSLITMPTPRFFVFYNGTAPMDDKVVYKLSDMFTNHTDSPSAELIVTAFNVNEGHNSALMETCATLKGYSIFVAKVRKYKQEAEEKYDAEHSTPIRLIVDKDEITRKIVSFAVSKAIDECIQEDILKDFFLENRQEVVEMCYLECTAEEQLQVIREDMEQIVRKEVEQTLRKEVEQTLRKEMEQTCKKEYTEAGIQQGVDKLQSLYAWLYDNNRADDVQKAISDQKYLNKLFEEFDSINK